MAPRWLGTGRCRRCIAGGGQRLDYGPRDASSAHHFPLDALGCRPNCASRIFLLQMGLHGGADEMRSRRFRKLRLCAPRRRPVCTPCVRRPPINRSTSCSHSVSGMQSACMRRARAVRRGGIRAIAGRRCLAQVWRRCGGCDGHRPRDGKVKESAGGWLDLFDRIDVFAPHAKGSCWRLRRRAQRNQCRNRQREPERHSGRR
jgi:hypothetical protein